MSNDEIRDIIHRTGYEKLLLLIEVAKSLDEQKLVDKINQYFLIKG